MSVHRYTTVCADLQLGTELFIPLCYCSNYDEEGDGGGGSCLLLNLVLDTILLDVFLIFLFPFDRTQREPYVFLFVLLLLVLPLLPLYFIFSVQFRFESVVWPPAIIHIEGSVNVAYGRTSLVSVVVVLVRAVRYDYIKQVVQLNIYAVTLLLLIACTHTSLSLRILFYLLFFLFYSIFLAFAFFASSQPSSKP